MRRRMTSNRSGRAGFTLVELLVSISLTVFMLTLFATLFSAGNDAVRIARSSGEIDRSIQGIVTKIKRDLQYVYVGDNVTLGKAFSAIDQVPTAGYFTIEENMPASPPYFLSDSTAAGSISNPTTKTVVQYIQSGAGSIPQGYSAGPTPVVTMYRQGIDERGLPVEVDVDDVLAFTVKLPGNSTDTVFYGKVPVGSILDSDLEPGSRFDQPDNGVFTSPYAEVVYFLRPNRANAMTDISHPALGTDNGRIATPATYTLYRRELLLLSPNQREYVEKKINNLSSNVLGLGPSASALIDMIRIQNIPSYLGLNPSLQSTNQTTYNPSFYQNYDVSAYYGHDNLKDPTNSNISPPNFYSLRFNDTTTVRLRQNRYGMQWLSPPYLINNILQPVPPDGVIPGYDHVLRTVLPLGLYVPGHNAAGQPFVWHGRPTLYESTMVGTEAMSDASYSPLYGNSLHASFDLLNNSTSFYPPLNGTTNESANAVLNGTASIPDSARRDDTDVLLTNVLSFDVKVFNDDIVQGLLAMIPVATGMPPTPPTSRSRRSQMANQQPRRSDELARCSNDARTADRSLGRLWQDVWQFADLPDLPSWHSAGNPSRSWSDPTLSYPISPAIIQQDFIDLGYLLTPEMQSSFTSGQPRCYWNPSTARHRQDPSH